MTVTDLAPKDARPDFAPNSDLPRHRWYKFKEGFSAGLVKQFVEENMPSTRSGRLLDPFMGSGTTALEAAMMGHDVCGVENNPFMAFLARVKTRNYTNLSGIELEATRCLKNRKTDRQFKLPTGTTLFEAEGLQKWLFNGDVARRFVELRTGISAVKERATRELLLLALIAAMEQVSNARKDGKCWRYKRDWQNLNYTAKSLDEEFANQVLRFVEDVRICPTLPGTASVFRGDARKFPSHFDDEHAFDAILTSPPYLNSFDYTDIYRPEMLLLNQARSSEQLRKYRLDSLRSHVQIAWKASAPLDIDILKKKVEEISATALWSTKIPQMINAYFVDLDRVVSQCSRRLVPGGTAAFVVADSAYNGIVIPVGQILVDLLERKGFKMKKITLFRNTNGNGNHQLKSSEKLKEVMISAEYLAS